MKAEKKPKWPTRRPRVRDIPELMLMLGLSAFLWYGGFTWGATNFYWAVVGTLGVLSVWVAVVWCFDVVLLWRRKRWERKYRPWAGLG